MYLDAECIFVASCDIDSSFKCVYLSILGKDIGKAAKAVD